MTLVKKDPFSEMVLIVYKLLQVRRIFVLFVDHNVSSRVASFF